MQVTVVGVRFRRTAKVYYFSPGEVSDLVPGDTVIVETSRGRELGRVIIGPRQVSDEEIVGELKAVERRATPFDRVQALRFQRREALALQRCRRMVAEHNLPMKVVGAEYNYDGTRLVFSFTAEQRVDFRELVRDLAKAFRARIELRQIGVRDEAKLQGGIGTCGREICCRAWLPEFSPVSIKMAKQQDLPLSPMEISGLCGRLLCCLAFEHETYVEARERLPKAGDMVVTSEGPGQVVSVNVLKETVIVRLPTEATIEVSVEDLAIAAEPEEPVKEEPKKKRKRSRRRKHKSDGTDSSQSETSQD